MTYLQLVNGVLTRLREDVVVTTAGSDDVVVNLVKEFVNDAKRTTEQAHTWSALSTEWHPSTQIGVDTVVLTDSRKDAIIDYIYDAEGNKLRPTTREELRRKAAQSGATTGNPEYYIIDGKEANGDVRLRVWPAPEAVKTYAVYGFQGQDDLAEDGDVLAVPSAPVIYMAEALASRERGEVGAQSSGELMAVAQRYLSDAIAIDSVNAEMDNVWYTV